MIDGNPTSRPFFVRSVQEKILLMTALTMSIAVTGVSFFVGLLLLGATVSAALVRILG